MSMNKRFLALALCMGLPVAFASDAPPRTDRSSPETSAAASSSTPSLDRSGRARRGKASFYGPYFFGRKMANGTPMDPQSNVAASRTLPLGTVAKVTNLRNGRSAVVEIKDRGPYVAGRIVDLSPATAEELDMVEKGVVPVEVAPIEVPLRDGSVKLGAGAYEDGEAGARASADALSDER
jgi:rare lipoprotein A